MAATLSQEGSYRDGGGGLQAAGAHLEPRGRLTELVPLTP